MVHKEETAVIPRILARQLADYQNWYPVISVTGPRQSGKSTLIKDFFQDYAYYNLEEEGTFNMLRRDPVGFLRDRPHRLIIDEAQRVPELFRAIQVVSDEDGSPGQYVLSGSQNYLLQRNVGQSLAGRVGLLRLLPLSYSEELASDRPASIDEFMLTGGYPRIYDRGIPPRIFYRNYVSTYVERDAAEYLSPKSLVSFHTFLTLLADSAGSLVNASRLATDTGISRATANEWLSLLEAGYVVFRLAPYQANTRKRLTKAPKLYFYDTGLLCHLLGLGAWDQLRDSERRGAVFENLIISETLKRHLNAGDDPRLFFYRDDSKVEVDLVDVTDSLLPELVEIKSSQAFRDKYVRHLGRVGDDLGFPTKGRALVTRGQETATMGDFQLWSAHDWLKRDATGNV